MRRPPCHRPACLYALPFVLTVSACRGRDEGPPLDVIAAQRGAAIYRAHCASCHGTRGKATPSWKRPDRRGDYPPPPHDSTGHTWHHADGLLYRIVETGVTDTTSRRPSRMPAFGATLTPSEIRAVLTYLKTLWTPAQRRRQREASGDDPFPASPRDPTP